MTERHGGEPRALRGAEATKAALAAAVPGVRLLHVATHGYFASGDADARAEEGEHAWLDAWTPTETMLRKDGTLLRVDAQLLGARGLQIAREGHGDRVVLAGGDHERRVRCKSLEAAREDALEHLA